MAKKAKFAKGAKVLVVRDVGGKIEVLDGVYLHGTEGGGHYVQCGQSHVFCSGDEITGQARSAKKAKSVADIHYELVIAMARANDPDFMVRMQGRKDVERLEKALARAERREQREGELS